MKRLFLFIFVLLSFKLFCDIISFSGLVNYNVHMEYEEAKDDNGSAQFEYSAKIPGIGQFFHNNAGINLEVEYFNSKKENKYNLSLIGGWSFHRIKSNEEPINHFFGEYLYINKIYLLIGRKSNYNFIDKTEFSNLAYFIAVGPVYNIYKGKTDLDDMNLVFEYDNSFTFRFNVGIDIFMHNSLNYKLSLSYDIGNIKRGYLNYYIGDTWAGDAKPIGEKTINDDQLILSLGLTWNYNFGSGNE